MFRSNLMSRAVELLRKRKGDFREIADACDVSYSWISKASQGQLTDAVAGRLERVIDHLETQEAELAGQKPKENGVHVTE
jgi:hypothetical protein